MRVLPFACCNPSQAVMAAKSFQFACCHRASTARQASFSDSGEGPYQGVLDRVLGFSSGQYPPTATFLANNATFFSGLAG